MKRKISVSESQGNIIRQEAERIKIELRAIREESEKIRIEFSSYRTRYSETEWQSLSRRVRELEAQISSFSASNSSLLTQSQMRVKEFEGLVEGGTRKVRGYMTSFVLVCAELEAVKLK